MAYVLRFLLKLKMTMLNTGNGNIALGEAFVLSPKTTYAELRSAFPDNSIQKIGNGYIWVYFDDIKIEEKLFYFSVCFYRQKLIMIDFLFKHPNEKMLTDWNEWSEQYELNRQKEYKEWLKKEIGRNRTFPWGNITICYDRKAAKSSIVVNYR